MPTSPVEPPPTPAPAATRTLRTGFSVHTAPDVSSELLRAYRPPPGPVPHTLPSAGSVFDGVRALAALGQPALAHARDSSDPSTSSSASSSGSGSGSGSSSTPPGRSKPTPQAPHAQALQDDPEEPQSTAEISATAQALWSHSKIGVPAARGAAPQPVPERCFTWCSQRNDRLATCRMMCFRRRAPVPTRAEVLARLSPKPAAAAAAAAAPEPKPPKPASLLEGLRARMLPYSLVFIKGTPEGVVGRYMEELESDDGQYDFGPLSRHAPDTMRAKSTGGVEWFDWGDSGYLLHVPFTSLFAPLLDAPANMERVFGPSRRLLENYARTFTDGTQVRGLARLGEEMRSGSAFDMGERLVRHCYAKSLESLQREREREHAAREEKADDVQDQVSQVQVKSVVKEKEGKGE